MKHSIPFVQRFGAELFGTFVLSLFVTVAVILGLNLITAVFAGLILGILVYTIGHVSGAHVNPAVTIGAFLINKIGWKEALVNIAAQFAGAGIALAVAMAMLNGEGSLLAQAGLSFTDTMPVIRQGVTNTVLVGVAELIGTALFTFGIASVIYGRVERTASGLVIGMSLIMGGILATVLGSGGILNPAVGLAAGHFNAMYILGPIVGSIIGMWLFTLLDWKA